MANPDCGFATFGDPVREDLNGRQILTDPDRELINWRHFGVAFDVPMVPKKYQWCSIVSYLFKEIAA